MKWGVIVFPGSNCDRDAHDALGRILKQEVRFIWHKETELGDLDGIILPGGFSYGDYLRSGAIATFSPVMNEVISFAKRGGIVIGICNGFQMLTESGLLPGALRQNHSLSFICQEQPIRVERTDTRFTNQYESHQVMGIPIAHHEGSYFLADNELKRLEDRGGVLFRYCSTDGEVDANSNPNGSVNNIAGIVNEGGNVLGMMPHPERRCDDLIYH
ncbi:MAG TPA: phosphoribosylformylglycinamidine synthase subunit PurQ, partial [Bacteroidetes bacterium]|nr:phosphoribosylformylglycinamidine synthase subunit PurQ [Bacteroidota bacterium]HEX05341.1 phosphoribosylformylglycinamidine synthase subunit PurQ [Bacteroidota bacterium]